MFPLSLNVHVSDKIMFFVVIYYILPLSNHNKTERLS